MVEDSASGARRRLTIAGTILALSALCTVLWVQGRRIDDLEEALAALERSRAAAKLDSAERRDDLGARISDLEAEIERLSWLPRAIAGEDTATAEENLSEAGQHGSAPTAASEDAAAALAETPDRIVALLEELTDLQSQFEYVPITSSLQSVPEGSFTFPPPGRIVGSTTSGGSNPGKPSWSEAQATGAPDTDRLGDLPTAWASKRPDEGIEWLEIDFRPGIVADAIVIIESHNPGALIKVEGGTGGSLQTLWSGTDPATEEANEFVISLAGGVPIETVRLTLDTRLVPGWNEIDAVGLEVGGAVIWGIEARASSSYADR